MTPTAPTLEERAKPHDALANGHTPTSRTLLIENVDVRIETYLGGAEMTVAELNALSVGDVIALDQALNAFVELRLNGLVIAHGELVSVGDKFGVRITNLTP